MAHIKHIEHKVLSRSFQLATHGRVCTYCLLPHADIPKWCVFPPTPLFTASGFDGNIDSQGELILQDSFQVWDPKTLIRKGRERHLFLFEMSLVFSKEVKDSNGHSKYLYKSKLFVSNVLFDLILYSMIQNSTKMYGNALSGMMLQTSNYSVH